MLRWLCVIVLVASAWPALAQDADGDGVPDAVEERIGSDPALATPLTVVFEDHAKGAGDESAGADLEVAHDLVNVAFGSLARNRWVWRLDFTEPWVVRGDVALIVYMDSDADPATGREGGGVEGTDLMIRPDSVSSYGGPGAARYTSATDGNSLYLAFDAPVKVVDGEALCRAYLLVQNRQNTADADRTPWFEARVPVVDAPTPDLPADHPMHVAPEVLEQIRVRVPIDDGGRRAIVTWITSWPTAATVQFGPTTDYGRAVETGLAQNHRAVLDGLEPGATWHCRIRVRGALGELISSEDVTFSAAVREPAGSVTRQAVPLRIEGAPGQRCPVTTGVPFPAGALGSAQQVRLLDAAGVEIPLQGEVLARWPDDTVKWLLLDFQADLPDSGRAEGAVEFGTQVRPTPVADPIAVDDAADAIVVDTGVLRVRFGRDEFALLGEAWLDRDGDGRYADNERVTDAEGAGIILTDLDGAQFTSLGAPDELVVTRRGPLHVEVTARGPHRSATGEALFRYEVVLHFYAGLPLVRVLHSVENDRVDETFTTVRSLDLCLPLAGGAQAAGALLPDGARVDIPAGGRLVQPDDNRFRVEGAPGAGERAPGGLLVEGPGGSLVIAVREFWQRYPKSVGANEQGAVVGIMPALPADEYARIDPELEDRLYYALLGGVYKLHSGVAATTEFTVRFGADAAELADEVERVNRPALAGASPQWYADSKVFGDITPRTPGEFEEYDAMADRVLASILRGREDQREYGMLNFGDYWGERGYNWGNIEYDTQHGLFLQFARSGRRDFFDNAVRAARHNLDVDIIHHARDATRIGLPYCHAHCHTGDYYPAGHRPTGIFTGGSNSGHLWTDGNLEYALLTGDARARRVALQTADWLAGPHTLNYRMSKGAERATAWPLFGLVAAYEATGDEYYLNATRIITRRVIAEQNPEAGHWDIPAGYSKVVPTPIGGYAWCAGLLMTSLEFANHYLQDPAIDASIVAAARWLARDEWIPERKGFRSASCPTLEASVTPGFECYRTPAAMLRAYELTGERQFLEIAHVGFAYAVARGGGDGKGGSVQLTITPHAVYKLKQAGITSLSTAPWDVQTHLRAPGWVPVEAGRPAAFDVAIANASGEPLAATVSVAGLPGGASLGPLRVSVAARGTSHARIELPELALQPGESATVTLSVRAGDASLAQPVVLDCPGPGAVGAGVGLIAGEEDFLAPALDEVGVSYQRLADLGALVDCRVVWLGTQAHTLNAAGIADDPARLLRWVHAGGTLVISQFNDDGWEPGFLPGIVVLDEENSTSGAIAAPDHRLFTTPRRVRDASGMMMYDTIARADGWEVLLADAAGRPAIIATDCGRGRILAIMPSVERYVTGSLTVANEAREADYWALFANIMAWAQGSD